MKERQKFLDFIAEHPYGFFKANKQSDVWIVPDGGGIRGRLKFSKDGKIVWIVPDGGGIRGRLKFSKDGKIKRFRIHKY